MNKLSAAIGIHIGIMVLVLLPPLLLIATGKTIYLETNRTDPRSLFRGHYAIVGYLQTQNVLPAELAEESKETGKPVYVVFNTTRPAKFVSAGLEKPRLSQNEVCIIGRARQQGWWSPDTDKKVTVDFPQIAQYFAPKLEAKAVERSMGNELLAKVKVSKGCNAVLLGLEPL